MKKTIALATTAVLAACGGGEGSSASNDPFCQQVLPRVAAFMDRARAENPTPDDPRYGGTVVVGGIGEIPDGMNAAVSSDYTANQHQLFVNLMTLRVEGVRTLVGWSDQRLITFLDRCGFHPSQRLCLEFTVK